MEKGVAPGFHQTAPRVNGAGSGEDQGYSGMADHGHASARGKMAGSQATREQQRGTIFEVSILNGTLLWPREADQLVPGLLRIWCVWFVFFVLLLFALGVFGLFCLFGYSSRSRRPSSALPDGPCELDGPCKVDGPCKLGSTALANSTALACSTALAS